MHKQALGNNPDTAMGVLHLSQRGENCSCRTVRTKSRKRRSALHGDPGTSNFHFYLTLSICQTHGLGIWNFWDFISYFSLWSISSHISRVYSAQFGGWGVCVDGNSSGKELNPSTVHLQPLQQEFKADCFSQPLLVCSLTFPSSCLGLLDPGNSETKSKIQSVQIDLSNISFQQSLTSRLDPESLRSYCSSWLGNVSIKQFIFPWHWNFALREPMTTAKSQIEWKPCSSLDRQWTVGQTPKGQLKWINNCYRKFFFSFQSRA